MPDTFLGRKTREPVPAEARSEPGESADRRRGPTKHRSPVRAWRPDAACDRCPGRPPHEVVTSR